MAIGGGGGGGNGHGGGGGSGYLRWFSTGIAGSSVSSIQVSIGSGGNGANAGACSNPGYKGNPTTVTISYSGGSQTFKAEEGRGGSESCNQITGHGGSGGGGYGNAGHGGNGGSNGSNGQSGANFAGGNGQGTWSFSNLNAMGNPYGFGPGAGGSKSGGSHAGGGGGGGIKVANPNAPWYGAVSLPAPSRGSTGLGGTTGEGYGAGGAGGGYNGNYYAGTNGASGLAFIYFE